jgi:hypothetical protein
MFTLSDKKLTSVSNFLLPETVLDRANLCACIKQGKPVQNTCDIKVCEMDLFECTSYQSLANLCQAKYGHSQTSIYFHDSKVNGQIAGIILAKQTETDFSIWFIAHVLENSHLSRIRPLDQSVSKSQYHTRVITELFEEHLRNITVSDEWDEVGKEYFTGIVDFFTSRNAKFEACLPAFPCKSQNTLKTAGVVPDKGEELALRHLKNFIDKVDQVYPPGMKLWIISDGHVFSDCSK